eukprot:Phypoly_transcript_16799.p1 GENE.Phypoly_transcript_16799~~Phypoly_transcript_16799.p1  ORF type:complete len:207 (+),score=29.15 Phypoly_transcript_16799:108-728(+)
MAESHNFDNLFKFIVVGSSGVGKSSILLQFTDHEFHSTHDSTIGIEFGVRMLTVDGHKVKVQIWDTAGQESYRSIAANYYRNAQAALLVYDITDKDSFVALKAWLDEILRHSDPEITITLIGNKKDMEEHRTVSAEAGEAFAREHSLLYVETSAKNATNVDYVFDAACKIVLQKVKSGKIKADRRNGLGVQGGSSSASEQKKACCG